MSIDKFGSDNFSTICERVKRELSINKDKQLIEIIGTTQPTFSRRKIDDNFSIEWAYSISIKTELLMKWILTGQGPKRINEKNGDDFFEELQIWAKEMSGSENINWLKNQIISHFPGFKEWKKRKEESEEERSDSLSSKVA